MTGRSPLTRPEKSAIEPEKSATPVKADLSDQLQQYLAAGSYYFLCGDSDVKGDGMYIFMRVYMRVYSTHNALICLRSLILLLCAYVHCLSTYRYYIHMYTYRYYSFGDV